MRHLDFAEACRASPRRATVTDAIMPGPFPESLQQKIKNRLRYYDDLGIRLFYRDRASMSVAADAVPTSPVVLSEEVAIEERELPKSAPKSIASKPASPREIERPVAPQVKEIRV